MKITAELRSKIDRSFSDANRKQNTEIDRKIKVARVHLQNEFADALGRLAQDPDGTEYLFKAMAQKMYLDYDPKTATYLIAEKLADCGNNYEIEKLYAEKKLADEGNKRKKEEFLIAISYAGGDIESIKDIFEKYGLPF